MGPVLPAVLALAAALGCAAPRGAASGGERPRGARLSVPVEYHRPRQRPARRARRSGASRRSRGVYYGIGFRVEPKDRTGFAHLFEHMMFQGSRNLEDGVHQAVQSNGGTLNGSTRFDFTNYYEVVPSNVLETVLWAEADRMRGLAVTKENLTNQQGVVNERGEGERPEPPVRRVPLARPAAGRERELVQRAQLLRRPPRSSRRPRSRTSSGSSRPTTRRTTRSSRSWGTSSRRRRSRVKEHFGGIRPAQAAGAAGSAEPRQEQEKRAEKVIRSPSGPRSRSPGTRRRTPPSTRRSCCSTR